jgi:hypothetical protein
LDGLPPDDKLDLPEDLSNLSLPEYPAPIYSGDDSPYLSAAEPQPETGTGPTVATTSRTGLLGRLGSIPGRLRRLRPGVGRPRLRSRRTIAALGGILVSMLVWPRLSGSAASASPSVPVPTTVVTATPGASPSFGPSGSPTGSATFAATPTATPSPIPVPSQTAPTASLVFRELALDSSVDPGRTVRSLAFASDGPGVVSVQVVASAPTDTTTLCVAVDGSTPICATGATPGFPRSIARTDHSRWVVTLISANESSPIVDVALSWPTRHPSVTLSGARFAGSPNPDSLRTLTADFKPRTAGRATLDAAWTPTAYDATATLIDSATERVIDQVAVRGAVSLSPTFSAAVAAGRTYKLTLFNESPDGPRSGLTVTIEFP